MPAHPSRRLRAAVLVLILAALTGCATITRGSHDVLVVTTEPPGAQVTISPDGGRCTTPCSMRLKRKTTYTVALSRAGFEPVTTTVQPQIVGAGAAGMAGNVLVGGLIGVIVDSTTGAMEDLKPNPLAGHVGEDRARRDCRPLIFPSATGLGLSSEPRGFPHPRTREVRDMSPKKSTRAARRKTTRAAKRSPVAVDPPSRPLRSVLSGLEDQTAILDTTTDVLERLEDEFAVLGVKPDRRQVYAQLVLVRRSLRAAHDGIAQSVRVGYILAAALDHEATKGGAT